MSEKENNSKLSVPFILKITSGKLNLFVVGFIIMTVFLSIWLLIISIETRSMFENAYNLMAFFSVTITYTILITHFIVKGHLKDFGQLEPLLDLPPLEIDALKERLYKKKSLTSLTVAAIFIGLIHSYIGNGPLFNLVSFSKYYTYTNIWITILIILIWVVTTNASAIYVRNLKLFAKLIQHTKIDILQTERLTPFIRTGVRSSLAFIGSYSLFPLLGLKSFQSMFLILPLLYLYPLC